MLKSILLTIFIVVIINGNLFSQPTFLKYRSVKSIGNKVDGNYVEYYANNQISLKGSFTNSKKNGQWLEYDEKGNLEESVNFKEDVLNGEYYFNDEKNTLKLNYVDGNLNGKYYYRKRDFFIIGNYEMGIPNGKFICYTGDTIINMKKVGLTWKSIECNSNNVTINYLTNITKKQINFIAKFVNGYIDGDFYIYNQFKPKISGGFMAGREINSLFDSVVQRPLLAGLRFGKYVNGKKTGKWTIILDGETKIDFNYYDGKINGNCLVYSSDCKVFCNVNIINGVRDDIWVFNTDRSWKFNTQDLDQFLGIELSESAKQKEAEVDAAANKKRIEIEEENNRMNLYIKHYADSISQVQPPNKTPVNHDH